MGAAPMLGHPQPGIGTARIRPLHGSPQLPAPGTTQSWNAGLDRPSGARHIRADCALWNCAGGAHGSSRHNDDAWPFSPGGAGCGAGAARTGRYPLGLHPSDRHHAARPDQEPGRDQRAADEVRFWAKFAPEGIEIEFWYIVMGVGYIVTLRVPPARLREVNRAVEQTAWGAFRTEFYPAYDARAIAKSLREQSLKKWHAADDLANAGAPAHE